MSADVLGFGPSLVDISAEVSDAQYDECQALLGIGSGEWARIDSPEDVYRLLGSIIGEHELSYDSFHELTRHNRISVIAGSSVFGMLGAMAPDLRRNSRLVTAVATHDGQLDPMSEFFNSAVVDAGVNHDGVRIDGHNPVGFVLSSHSTTEKLLAMYPGVATELVAHEELDAARPKLVIMDAYEMQDGKLANFLDGVVMSGAYQIGLSLGNHVILQGNLLDRIRGYIDAGKISVLCGNEREFQTLFGEHDPDHTSFQYFRDHPVHGQVPFVLLTRGPEGLSAHWDGKFIDVPAHPMPQDAIKNTSGAGDTVAGVFYAGVLRSADPHSVLHDAAYLATETLRLPGSMVIATK